MSERLKIQEVEIPEGKELLEDTFLCEFVLEESTEGGGKKPKLKGRFGLVDEATANKRLYPRKVMSREIQRLQEGINGKTVYGELDHPGDGKTKLQRVSHMVTGLQLEGNGEIQGTLEIIPGTSGGDQALAIAKAGGKLGISSRGFGSTSQDMKGNHVVQEDYQLVTFDLVADPANAGAYPEYVLEHKEDQTMDLDTLKKSHPELVEAIQDEIASESRTHAREALTEEFDGKLAEAIEEVKAEALEEARQELMSDPEVAGANTAMRDIVEKVRPFILREDEESLVSDLEKRLVEAEKRIAKADEARLEAVTEAEELAELAKEAYFHLYLERNLHGDPRREQVEAMLGDVTQYDSLDDVRDRIGSIVEALDAEQEVLDAKDQEIAKLKAENAKLAEDMERTLTVGNQFAVKAYIEKKLGRHPKAAKLRTFLDEMAPMTAEEVDSLVETFDEEFPISDEYRRIQEGLESDDSEDLTEEAPTMGAANRGNVYGVPMSELATRAGVKGR